MCCNYSPTNFSQPSISSTLYQRFSSTLSISQFGFLLLKIKKTFLFGVVTMKVRWKILLMSMTMWLIGEISLNLVGLDEFADYGEFLQYKYILMAIV